MPFIAIPPNPRLIGLLLSLSISPLANGASDIAYPDFRAPSRLIFQGDAALHEHKVRLAPAQRGKAGGLWLQEKQFVRDGFETTFQFQLTDKGGFGADGLAFVVQNIETPRLGHNGRGMGFGGVSNVMAVKFDPYHFQDGKFVKFDEVAVLAGRFLDTSKTDPAPLAAATHAVYTDEKVHSVKVLYRPGHLAVYLDDFETPLVTASLNLADAIGLDTGRAWIGLTAATGADYYNHDILNWTFTPSAAPPPNNPAIAHAPSAASTPTHTPPATTASLPGPAIYASAPAPTLEHDPAFGSVLPPEIALTHQIEASSDLVNWTAVTNVILYFRDPDSINHENRFYRFRQN